MARSWASRHAAIVACLMLMLAPSSAQEAVYSIKGSGTTNPSKLFWYLMDQMQSQSSVPLLLTYRGIGSGGGQTEFKGSLNNATGVYVPFNDFGSGDVPMPQSTWSTLSTNGLPFVQIPIMARCLSVGPVGIFFNLPGINALKINACVLSKIFQGVVTQWNDPSIATQNPGVALPSQQIKIMQRKSGSSSTNGVTNYLKSVNLVKNANDPSCQWNLSVGTTSWGFSSGSTWTAPATSSFTVQDGSDQMSNALLGTPYSLGYIEAGHGHSVGLQEVALNNSFGVSLTSQQSNIAAVLDSFSATTLGIPNIGSNPGASWADVSMINLAGSNTFPILLVTYIYAPLTVSGYKGALLKAFISYLLSPVGQAAVPQFEFTALPQVLLNAALQMLDAIQVTGSPAPGPWIIESASGPNSYTSNTSWLATGLGAAPATLSVNRNSWAAYQRNYNSLNVSALQAQVAALQAQVAALQAAAASPPSAMTFIQKVQSEGVDVAAIIIALIALIIGSVGLGMAVSLRSAAAKYGPQSA